METNVFFCPINRWCSHLFPSMIRTVEPHGFRQMAPNTQKHRSPPAVHIAGGRELTYTSHPGIKGKNHVHKNARKRERVLVISSKSYICKFMVQKIVFKIVFIGWAIPLVSICFCGFLGCDNPSLGSKSWGPLLISRMVLEGCRVQICSFGATMVATIFPDA